MSHIGLSESVQKLLLKQVTHEAKNIINSVNSKFVLSNMTEVRSPNYMENLHQEMESKCPISYAFLVALGHNIKQLKKNKVKTLTAVKNPTLQAFALLLNIRNRRINAVQAVNSIILRRGGADKKTFQRLNSVGICTGYSTVLNVQDDLGIGFDKPVRTWIEECSKPVWNKVRYFYY